MPNYRSLLFIKSHPMNYSENQKLHLLLASVCKQINALECKRLAALRDAENFSKVWLVSGMAKGFQERADKYERAMKNRIKQHAALSLQLLQTMKPPVQKPAPVWSGNRITAKTVAA